MRKHVILGATLTVVGVLGLASGVATATSGHSEGGANRITICHATASESNPYVRNTVDDDSIFKQGHDQHTPGGRADIIPPFEYTDKGVTSSYPGRSWDAEGRAIWENGCSVPEPTDPPVTEPPVTEPPVTEPPVTEPPVTEPPTTQPPVTEPPFVSAPNVHLTYLCEQDGVAKWRARNNGEVDGTYRIVREGTGEVLWQGTIVAGGTHRFTAPASEGSANTIVVQRPSAEGDWEQAGPKAMKVEGDVSCEPETTEPPTTEPPVTEPPVTEPPVTNPEVTQPPATPQPSVGPETVTPGALPETGPGSGTIAIALAGLASLAGGLALLTASRRSTTA